MTKPTGRPPGRPKGAKNKRSAAIAQAAQETAEHLNVALPKPFKGDAHALLMAVYKNEELDLPLRIDAAKAALKFEKPALSSVTATINHQPSAALHDDDLARRAADLAADVARLEAEALGGHGGAVAAASPSGKPH